jgi:hypothetical protein
MIDWVNIVLRTLMCLAFLVLVLRPMMLALIRREPDQEALEELANSAVNSAFKAWRQNSDAPAYYQNPELALLVLNNPEVLNIPDKPAAQEPALVESEASSNAVSGEATAGTQPVDAVARAGEANAPATQAAFTETGEAISPVADAAPAEEDIDPDEQLQQMRDRIKKEQKKAKPTIPTELLNNANSYEDKLMVVRMIVDQERDRVGATLKRMIQVE